VHNTAQLFDSILRHNITKQVFTEKYIYYLQTKTVPLFANNKVAQT